MQLPVIASLNAIDGRPAAFLAIGTFDGVHRGHQALLAEMIAAAHAQDAQAVVLTFIPHPRAVLEKDTPRFYLTTADERSRLLTQLGVDLIINHPFNKTVQHTRAADFIAQINAALSLQALWGSDFGFGYQREGDYPFLQGLGNKAGFAVHKFAKKVEWNGAPISSSRIRRALSAGDILDVNGCLGRPFQISGTIIKGDQRGRTIGFPTANLDIWPSQRLPATGVYACIAHLNGKQIPAATNIGLRPTVDGSRLSIEAHLLDFSADIYNQQLTLSFISRIRPEIKFSGLDALIDQIGKDVQTVRTLLAAIDTV